MQIKLPGSIVLSLLIITACGDDNQGNQQNENKQSPQQEQRQQTKQGQQAIPQAPQQQAPPQQQQSADVDDAELKQFASAVEEVQTINREMQQKMIAKVEEEGMDVDRFSQIQQAQQRPDQNVEATDKEMELFNAANKKLEKIQKSATERMKEKIKEEGLTEKRYQEIGMMIQNDPQLQQKFQQLRPQPQQQQPQQQPPG